MHDWRARSISLCRIAPTLWKLSGQGGNEATPMIRTIQQRIYVVGLLPLAMLAVAMVVYNGLARIDEANQELKNARAVTAALLQSQAVDALIVGNTLNFEQTVKNVIKTSPLLVCVTLRDADHRMVAQVGKCSDVLSNVEYLPVTALSGDFSDFNERVSGNSTLGELGLLMNEDSIERKRYQVIAQLTLSLSMIAIALGFVGWLLRARLIEPIRRIGHAMQALSQRDYSVRVQAKGDDELSRLAEAINTTIITISTYTRELERRRSDADRALQDADEASLARDGLVRSLTEDIEEPMALMHAELMAIAIENRDPALRDRIKAVIARLQRAQTDFADLMEIASTRGTSPPPPRDLEDVLSDIERDILLLSEGGGVSVNFVMTQMPSGQIRPGEPTGIFVDVDAVRLKKALVYLIRSMGRRCKESRVYVNAELVTILPDQLHLSVHLKAFYDPHLDLLTMPWPDGLSRYGKVPAIVGWTDRETRTIDYLLQVVGAVPTVSVSPAGAVSIHLDITCHYVSEAAERPASADWTLAERPVSVTLVSNDLSITRIIRRVDMSDVEVKLISFARAFANTSMLRAESALLIDMSDDIADAVSLLDELRARGEYRPCLIAICPPGHLSDSLSERLLDLGFTGTIQKPLHHSRVVEAIRIGLSDPLKAINPKGGPGSVDK
jgi:HAMP domain-containing protein